MSARAPFAPVVLRAARREMPAQMLSVAEAVRDDYEHLDEPRDTGLLLRSLDTDVTPEGIHVSVLGAPRLPDREPPQVYGAILERGTLGEVIIPTRAEFMTWVSTLTGKRIFRKIVPGSDAHKGWWTRWRTLSVPAAVRRGWHKEGR